MIATFAEMPGVSLAMNAGTIERRHFLDKMVLTPSPKIKSFFDDALEKTAVTADDYGNIVMAAIRQLYLIHAHVCLF
jgi:hypothetical protein